MRTRTKTRLAIGMLCCAAAGLFADEPTTGIQLGDTLIPTGNFPGHIANKGYGGWHVATNEADMLAIPDHSKPEGTAAWRTDTEELYTWDGTAWEVFQTGASTNDVEDLEANLASVSNDLDTAEAAIVVLEGQTNDYLNADGSVDLTGDLNLTGNTLSNGFFVGDGSGLTNLSADAITLTGHDVIELDDVSDAGSGIIISATERTKLDGVEDLADVTDATNVEAAGAVMDADIGVTVQAYDADLDDLADGTLSKSKVEDSGNWDTAYGWGDHATNDYLTAAMSSVTNMNDVSDAGSGAIITTNERSNLATLWADFYYVEPTVSFSSGGGTYEQGSTVADINLSFTCNKAMIGRDYSGGHVEALGAGQNNTQTLVAENITATTTYTVTVEDDRTATDTASKTYTFRNRTFYGVSSEEFGTLSNADILAMNAKWETKGDARSVALADEYIYVAYPEDRGDCTSFAVGGFGTSAWPKHTRNVTNSSGSVESYIIYRANNKQTSANISYDIH